MTARILIALMSLTLLGCNGADDSGVDTAVGCHSTPPAVSPDTLADGTVGEAYSQQLTAFGGEEVFALDSGALPDGLTLSEAGLIEGTPATAGEFQFAVTSTVDTSDMECPDGGPLPTHPAYADYTLTIVEAG